MQHEYSFSLTREIAKSDGRVFFFIDSPSSRGVTNKVGCWTSVRQVFFFIDLSLGVVWKSSSRKPFSKYSFSLTCCGSGGGRLVVVTSILFHWLVVVVGKTRPLVSSVLCVCFLTQTCHSCAWRAGVDVQAFGPSASWWCQERHDAKVSWPCSTHCAGCVQ